MKKGILIGLIAGLVLTGTAAAGGYVVTSVNQIKPSVRSKLKGNRGPRGYTGTTGATGAISQIQTVNSPSIDIPPGDTSYEISSTSLTAYCPSGYVVVGTGFNSGIGRTALVLAAGNFVGGFVYNDTSVTLDDVYVQAICGQTGSRAQEVQALASRKNGATVLRAKQAAERQIR